MGHSVRSQPAPTTKTGSPVATTAQAGMRPWQGASGLIGQSGNRPSPFEFQWLDTISPSLTRSPGARARARVGTGTRAGCVGAYPAGGMERRQGGAAAARGRANLEQGLCVVFTGDAQRQDNGSPWSGVLRPTLGHGEAAWPSSSFIKAGWAAGRPKPWRNLRRLPMV